MQLPADPRPIFELNQARRAKVTLEMEALRSGKYLVISQISGIKFVRGRIPSLPKAFLERPNMERLAAFVEKRVEYNQMMEDQIEFFRTATHEQRVYDEAMERAAKLAEERRLQEFHRALERMNPVEAEAVQQAERERSLRLQREKEVRAAALAARVAHERARVQAKFPFDRDGFERLYNRS
jgi:hypothetical protein